MLKSKQQRISTRRLLMALPVVFAVVVGAGLLLRGDPIGTAHVAEPSAVAGNVSPGTGQPPQSTVDQTDGEVASTGQEAKSITRNQAGMAESGSGSPVDVGGSWPAVTAGTHAAAKTTSLTVYTRQQDKQQPREKEDFTMPEWERIITPDGSSIDMVGAKGRQGSDGIPDYVEIYSGFEAGYVDEVISNGIASDSSALLIARDVSQEILYNGVVRTENDLGNAMYLLNVSPRGNLRIFVGVERLLSELPTFVEFEFNQDLMQVGSGVPWWEIQGTRQDGDLLVRFNLIAGRLTSVELAQWQNGGYFIFETDTDGLGVGCRDNFSFIYCMGAPPLDRSRQVIEVWDSDFIPVKPTLADSFAELGLDLDRLRLSAREFSGVYIRTPEDVVMTSFRAIGGFSAAGGVGSP